MITSLNPCYDLLHDMVGYTIEEIETPKLGEAEKIYIPKLMPLIEHKSPKTDTIVIKSANLFCNADACKPNFKKSIHTQNFLTLRSDVPSTNWSGIEQPVYDGNGYLEKCIIPVGTKVSCKFENGTLKEPIFSNSGYPSRLPDGAEDMNSYDTYIGDEAETTAEVQSDIDDEQVSALSIDDTEDTSEKKYTLEEVCEILRKNGLL